MKTSENQPSTMTEPARKSILRKIIPIGANLLSYAVFAALAILLRASISPVRRGFFCDDLSIKYPVVSSQTVKTSVLLAVSFSIAAVIFAVTEYLNFKQTGHLLRFRFLRMNLPVYILKACKLLLLFSWGVVATSVITDVTKVSTGVLRPNFISKCKPNITCEAKEDFGIYHEDYVCQSVINLYQENSLRSSFPSGHSSQAAFAAIFLIVYTQLRLTGIKTPLVLPFLHLSLICLALWSSMTRISDHVHHAMDVLVGIIIGIGVGFAFGVQTIKWIQRIELSESAKRCDEEKHLATLRSDIVADRSPNGQV